MNEILAILCGVGILTAAYFFRKASSAEALNKNNEVKDKLLDIDKQKLDNSNVINMEEKRREYLLKNNEGFSNETLVKFFNYLFTPKRDDDK